MTTPDPGSLNDAPEADVAEQNIPVDQSADDAEDAGVFTDAERVARDRDWQANEADLLEQSIDVPIDDAEFDR
ncbi:hypothetical protein CRI77_23165 [Mycolicibacterium duvalii]|uniref:Uncharacterized protein n=1 Tax=Mycolicibacterium duvalii TaxID=39688 RepID=A0A7I7JYH4_9MYCO|nr:hypothetical protein [Mycolicibacterium duvalii]MCV7369637.1 hypothetical protein [Mycolicibacterium duvalii]PEG36427.1 hypothetical protein CRI77_23165 [Mycolicibacterium duvalii]BBX16364.1 hypothetical protein MDUV_12240 [Mycolicibacterium duvalii]